jgi:purine-binding chemotaxis protein CheW
MIPSSGASPVPVDARAAGRWCCFRLGGDRFAVDSAGVVEVVRGRRLTPVPLAGAGVLGLLHMRGRIVPVIDLAAGLGVAHEAGGAGAGTRLVIALGDDWYGLAVDEMLDVIEIPAARVERPTAAGGCGAAMLGTYAAGEGLVHLLDPEGMIHALVRQPHRGVSRGGSHGGNGTS